MIQLRPFAGCAAALAAMGSAALLVAASAQAEVIANDRFSFSFTLFNPCANGGAGEDVYVSAVEVAVWGGTTNRNGTVGFAHFGDQGTGIGVETGTLYQYIVARNPDPYRVSLRNGQAQFTTVDEAALIAPGKGNDAYFHLVSHVTLNASGEVAALFVNSTEGWECR